MLDFSKIFSRSGRLVTKASACLLADVLRQSKLLIVDRVGILLGLETVGCSVQSIYGIDILGCVLL